VLRTMVRWILRRLYRVKLIGAEHFEAAGERVLIVANHTSFLDPVLLWAFLPESVTFAINTHIAQRFWVSQALRWVQVFPMDPTKPMSVKALTHLLRQNRKAVVFPEGRITVTGALMKIYDGAGLIADKAAARVLPIRVDGAQYTPFSRLRGVVRLRWFPSITLNILPPHTLELPPEVRGDGRRKRLGTMLEDLMTEMLFATGNHRRTLFAALLDARKIHGGRRVVLEDMQRKPWTYNDLITRTLGLGAQLAKLTEEGEAVGLLLPSANGTVATLLGLQIHRRTPALLNFSAGARSLFAACAAASIRTVVTARHFVEMAKLEDDLHQLGERVRFVYLEDLAGSMRLTDKAKAVLRAARACLWGIGAGDADAPAAILFTSGSEGTPKGVVLSHANLLSNREQLAAKVDFNGQDKILNALPLFHSFGLTAGTLLPLLSGMRTFLYPSPLHYRIIPEIAYDINATILFGTNTFLSGYARSAHPYDFYSMRYVFAGAEKLQPETRRLWSEKFGIRVLEGYGATETSPVLAVNTPMHYRANSVGRFLPGIRYHLEPVPGVSAGGRLHVSGPNVMLGYLLPDSPGKLIPPVSVCGQGWYDTGDLVEVDDEGFVTIQGRVKRFAKVGGEMVSLAAVEELAGRRWPEALHAAITLPDARKGEQIVLVSDCRRAERAELVEYARREGFAEIHLPRAIHVVERVPLLSTGKIDYPAVVLLLNQAGSDSLLADSG
jgi:acyl-[acyl-carrier-protein]-phospholipid O-acyltransferase/long-chain-fatty-acid--[acyl-carrier-protein] ligase